MYVTTNGGASWTQVSGVPAGTGAGITGILFYSGGGQVGGVTQGIYASSNGHGVYTTVNGGSTWTLTSGGPTNVVNAAIDSSGNYYAIGNSGANGFKYSGGSWSNILSPASGDVLQAVAVNPFNTIRSTPAR
jgi:hypothetical protein